MYICLLETSFKRQKLIPFFLINYTYHEFASLKDRRRKAAFSLGSPYAVQPKSQNQ